ncbi:hypothetical protein [Paenibacillus apis]|uniref:hypothetical protein n=1 Tax=Paenibacillus apis TaxID=1792174 RepID=UPI002657B98D|nr:hypothetical protein [Paenibacillus apis]
MEKIYSIRKRSDYVLTWQRKLIHLLIIIMFGVFMGFLAKYFDGTEIGLIGSKFGVWIFSATIIATLSRSSQSAALHVFAFFVASLSVYYFYSSLLFGFFPTKYVLMWAMLALTTPVGGWIVWFARGKGWVSSICAALPIALILVEGVGLYYSFLSGARYIYLDIVDWFDILLAVALLLLLPRTFYQLQKILIVTLCLFLVLEYIGIYQYLSV